MCLCVLFFFFFNDTATTEIYTLSLHDALPILSRPIFLRDANEPRSGLSDCPGIGCDRRALVAAHPARSLPQGTAALSAAGERDRKSTRLNSSHLVISYAVFCLKKKTILVVCVD